jgi:outer membrane lipopolysaccharide assembly protein LptE/RlpB
MIKKILIIGLLVINLWLCSSCGFHARSAEDLPKELNTIALRMPNIDSGFQEDITRLFHSLHVKIDSNAPVALDISEFNFSHIDPELTTTAQAVTYTYNMTLTFSLIKNNKIVVSSKTLHASRSIIMNVNQVYTSSTVSLAKHELEREIINTLYYQLISQNTQHALQNNTN